MICAISVSDLYYKNPQYFIRLITPDKDDIADLGECTCVISLMQKSYRKRRFSRKHKRLIVGFDVHQVYTFTFFLLFCLFSPPYACMCPRTSLDKLHIICLEFKCQGHRSKIKLTKVKKVKIPGFSQSHKGHRSRSRSKGQGQCCGSFVPSQLTGGIIRQYQIFW